MKGIRDYNEVNGVLGEQPLVQGGVVAAVSLTSPSYKDVSVTFPESYAEAPAVVAIVDTTATSAQYGNITASATNVTANGFTLRRFLASANSTNSVAARWMAAGKRAT